MDGWICYILIWHPVHFREANIPLISLCGGNFVVGVIKEELSQGREEYLEAVSPERSLAAEEAFSEAEQEEEGEEEEEEREEEEETRTECSAREEEEEEEEEEDEGEEVEEMEEGRGVLMWE